MSGAAAARPERGLIVGARYRLESVLGEGGMAVVWRATHTETDRAVALKLVRPEFVQNEQVRDMFVREARVAARIGRNEHIVDVLDAGIDETLKVPFLAMELLVGRGLDDRIREGPIPRGEVRDLLVQLADGLEQAHAAGVFHRDLKPQNLFLTQNRRGESVLKIVDFGIAKLSESTTQSATHVGTPAYAAPEQLGESWRSIAKGRNKTVAAQVSAATDVWALGLIAFEMLAGVEPGVFWGATTLAELPVKIVLEPLPPAATRADPALIPPGFDAWLARCLDLDAHARWPSARSAVDALLLLLDAPPRVNNLPSSQPTISPAAPVNPGPAPHPNPNPNFAPGFAQPPTHIPGSQPRYPSQVMPHGAHPQGAWPYPQQPATYVNQAPVHPQLQHWAQRWRAELRVPGDLRVINSWPVVYLPRADVVSREAKIPLAGGATLTMVEAVATGELRRAMGEDRMLVALLQSPRLLYRVALRSKRSSGGFIDGMERGLKALDALVAPAAGVLGDPQFESQFEVWSSNPMEARAAVPVGLRQLLLMGRFHGVLERFPGGVLVLPFHFQFAPDHLDRVIDLCTRIYGVV